MKKIVTEIIQITDETHDTKTFRVKNDAQMNFIAGQFCLVSQPDHEKFNQLTRPFTFSSSPAEVNFFEMTIKKMGEFTSAMFELNIDDRLQILGPRGESLNFNESIQEDLVFLAGGSGITPFMSILQYWLAKKLSNKITLLYANRTDQDIIYKEQLNRIAKDHKKFRLIHILGTASSEIHGEVGRISQKITERYVSEPLEKIWYICGPPPMVEAMKDMLITMKIPKRNWRVEQWQLPGKNQK